LILLCPAGELSVAVAKQIAALTSAGRSCVIVSDGQPDQSANAWLPEGAFVTEASVRETATRRTWRLNSDFGYEISTTVEDLEIEESQRLAIADALERTTIETCRDRAWLLPLGGMLYPTDADRWEDLFADREDSPLDRTGAIASIPMRVGGAVGVGLLWSEGYVGTNGGCQFFSRTSILDDPLTGQAELVYGEPEDFITLGWSRPFSKLMIYDCCHPGPSGGQVPELLPESITMVPEAQDVLEDLLRRVLVDCLTEILTGCSSNISPDSLDRVLAEAKAITIEVLRE
jgi:hypothetical protein